MANGDVRLNLDPSATESTLGKILLPWLTEKTERVASTARGLAPVGPSGELGGRIESRVEGSGTKLVGWVVANVAHAGYVVKGTRPHVITPRNATVLRFVVDGQVVFARAVQHPGTSPNNFLLAALLGEMS